jgi:hypothetical protein
VAASQETEEIAMFAIRQNRNPVQRAVCLTLAGFIVSIGLAAGAFGVHVAERNASAVIVEQIA